MLLVQSLESKRLTEKSRKEDEILVITLVIKVSWPWSGNFPNINSFKRTGVQVADG